MKFFKYETTKGAFYISDQYRKRKRIFVVFRKLSDTFYEPVFPDRIFGSLDKALKAIDEAFF